MNLRDRLDKITELEVGGLANLPWDVRRVLPDIKIAGNQISLCKDGDYLEADEILRALNILVSELTPSKPVTLSEALGKLPTETPAQFEEKIIGKLRKSAKKPKKKGSK